MTFQVYTRYTGTHNLILTWLLEVCRKKESSKGKSKHKASLDMKQLGMQQPETSKCQTVQNLKVGTATALQQIQHFKSWSTAQVWGQKNVIKVKARPGYAGLFWSYKLQPHWHAPETTWLYISVYYIHNIFVTCFTLCHMSRLTCGVGTAGKVSHYFLLVYFAR